MVDSLVNAEVDLPQEHDPETRRVYFHAFDRVGFKRELGVVSNPIRENVTDFLGWSSTFPYEKISNYSGVGATEREKHYASLLDSNGDARFAIMVLDGDSPVKRLTDRYRHAFTARGKMVDTDTSRELSAAGRTGWFGGDEKTTIGAEHYLAEIPITRQFQERMLDLKIDIALMRTNEEGVAKAIEQFFAEQPDKFKPIIAQDKLDGGYGIGQLSEQLAQSLMRSFALRYIPALIRLTRAYPKAQIPERRPFNAGELQAIWSGVGQQFSSPPLKRYWQQAVSQLQQELLLPSADRLATGEIDARQLMLTLNADPFSKERYFPSAGLSMQTSDDDFYGYYFSSGELTFWGQRKDGISWRWDELFKRGERQQIIDMAGKLSDEELVIFVDAYENLAEKERRGRFLLGSGSWALEQMEDDAMNLSTETGASKQFAHWIRATAEDMPTTRVTQLNFEGETLGGIENWVEVSGITVLLDQLQKVKNEGLKGVLLVSDRPEVVHVAKMIRSIAAHHDEIRWFVETFFDDKVRVVFPAIEREGIKSGERIVETWKHREASSADPKIDLTDEEKDKIQAAIVSNKNKWETAIKEVYPQLRRLVLEQNFVVVYGQSDSWAVKELMNKFKEQNKS